MISQANAAGTKIGLCGQAPSDHPDFAAFLVECGIDSVSVSPDSFLAVKRHVGRAEAASPEADEGAILNVEPAQPVDTSIGESMYTFDKTLPDTSMEEALVRTRKALAGEGFGVLTEIDVRKTLKEKIGAEVDDYVILGACNPKMAHEALKLEPRIGAMLPCNVIVRSAGGGVEVSAIDPVAAMTAVDNPKLGDVAKAVRGMLQAAVDKI